MLLSFSSLVWIWIGIALVLFPIQLFITAPYGRHTNRKWGLLIDNKIGWFIMEIVSLLVFAGFFLSGPVAKSNAMWVFFLLWTSHYINRSLIFPWRTKTSGKKIPLAIVLFAMFFNVINGSLNGYYLGYLSDGIYENWFSTWQFWTGLIIFCSGVIINLLSDGTLLRLRKPGDTGYKIPNGGLFKWISCPNHFGEIVEWCGFAIMCWNLPALSFAIWTVANLMPRALSHHRWYRQCFSEYPQERKAVIPFIV